MGSWFPARTCGLPSTPALHLPQPQAGRDWTSCLAQRSCSQVFMKYRQLGAGDAQPLTGQVLSQKVAEAAALAVTEENGSSL